MIDQRIKGNLGLQAKLTSLVIDSKSTIMNNNRSILEQRWNRYYEIYRGLKTRGMYQGRANLDWASLYIAIETLVPRVYRALMPRPKWFGVMGNEESDFKQASIIESYLNQRFDNPIKLRSKIIPMLRYLAIFGTLICKTPYRVDKHTNTRGEEIITYDDVDLQLVDIFDFYPADDTIETIEDQPFVIHTSREPLETIKEKEYDQVENPFGAYENLRLLEMDMSEGKDANSIPKSPYLFSRLQSLGIVPRIFKHQGPQIVLDEYQGTVDINGSKELFIVTVANNSVIVQAEPLETPDHDKTYVKGEWTKLSNEFWGMPVGERIEKTIYELNDRVNQTMDATSLMINPIWIKTDAEIPEGRLHVFPGRVVDAITKDGLSALRPPTEVLNPAYTAIQSLISMIQDTTGATRFLGGSAQSPELQRTATGIVSIIKEANARIDLVVQGLEDSFMKPFLRKAYKYAQLYSEREKMIRVVGKHGIEYQKVNLKDIAIDVDFRPLGSQSLGAEELQTQQMINFFNIIAKIPALFQQIDLIWLVQKIAQRMLGMEDADEMIRANKREEEDRERAVSENVSMMRGAPVEISPGENHRLHIQIHEGMLRDPRFESDPTIAQTAMIFREHIDLHNQYSQFQGAYPMAPEGPQGQQGQQGQQGVPAQEQPRANNLENLINQLGQPSQEGTL